jgi:hypothetical protein
MSNDLAQPAEEPASQKTREAAEESKALGSLTDHVRPVHPAEKSVNTVQSLKRL